MAPTRFDDIVNAAAREHALTVPSGASLVGLLIRNGSGGALTSLAIVLKTLPGGSLSYTIPSASYATPTGRVLDCESTLNTLANGATGIITLDVRGVAGLTITTSSAVSVEGRWS